MIWVGWFGQAIKQRMRDEYQQSQRYHTPTLTLLLERMEEQTRTQQLKSVKSIEEERKMSSSFSAGMERGRQLEQRPLFNNKTRQGSVLDAPLRPLPYKFIPKYKNDTFIMPGRVFEKGRAGKRFYVKMKDSSICSFSQQETPNERVHLHREEKERTVLSRKVEEFNRVIDLQDGCIRANNYQQLLKTRRKFNFTDTRSDLFSQSEPMIEPKDEETRLTRKISLAKTFNFSGKWLPNSRALNFFEKRASSSAQTHYKAASVL